MATEIEQKPAKSFFAMVGEILGIWSLANIGYYFLFPYFGLSLSYNASPLIIAIYFGVWAVLTIYNFWGVYRRWLQMDMSMWMYGLLSLISAGFLWGLVYVFSLLPAVQGPLLTPYTDILLATPWYFLPKAVEILVQQLLIVVLILELHFHFQTFKNVIIGYVICFGGAHVLLFLLDKAPAPYAIVFTVSAVLTAFIFPYLILRVKGGFVYAYLIHFFFYILLASILHVWPPVGYLV